MEEQSVSNRAIPVLVGVTVFGALLRLYQLGAESMWVDEGLFMMTIKLVGQPQNLMSTSYVSDAPLFYFVAAAWEQGVQLLTSAPYATEAYDTYMRVLPATISIANIPLTYVLGSKLTGRKEAALFGAFFCALSPFQVYYAQEMRPYSFHVTICILAALAMIRALDRNRWRDWLLFGLCMVVGIYNHFFMVFCIMAMNVWFLFTIKVHLDKLKPWIVMNVLVIVAALPGIWLAMSIQQIFESGDETWYPVPNLKLGLISFKNFFAGYGTHVVVYQVITLLAGALCLTGLYSLRKEKRNMAGLIALATAPILVGIAYWSTTNFPYYTHRLMIFSAIPCYLLAGLGIQFLNKPLLKGIAVVGIGLLTVPALDDLYHERLHPMPEHTVGVLYKIDNRGASEFIQSRRVSDEPILHRVRNTYWPQRYYTGVGNYIVDINGQGIQDAMKAYPDLELFETAGALPFLIDEKAPADRQFFYIQSWWQPYNLDALSVALAQHLDNRFVRIDQKRFDGQTVYVYDSFDEPFDFSRRAQVADAGNLTFPYYAEEQLVFELSAGARLNQDSPDSPQHGQEMKPSFWATLYPLDGYPRRTDYTADDERTSFSVYLHNDEKTRDLEVTIYQVSQFIEPMAMDLSHSMEGTWYPEYQFEPIAPDVRSNILAWTANIETDEAQEHAIQGTYELAAGAYRVMANVRYVTDPALLRFTVENDTETNVVGEVMEPVSLAEMGWRWTDVGAFETDGTPFALKVTTHPGAEPEHHRVASLGRIVLVPDEEEAEYSPVDPVRRSISLAPNETTIDTISLKRLPGDGQHIMIEIKEPMTNQYRNLYFYVPNSGRDEGDNQ